MALSIMTIVLFFIFMYRPYIKLLHQDTRALAGMLSQLPAEVDVEGHVKAVVLGSTKPPAAAMGQATMGPNASQNFGMGGMMGSMPGQGNMLVPAGAMALHMGPSAGPGVRTSMEGYGYGGGRGKNPYAHPGGQDKDPYAYAAGQGNGRWFGQDNNTRGVAESEDDGYA